MTKTTFLTFALGFLISPAFCQVLDQKINLEAKNETIEEVLDEISERYAVSFSYLNNQLPKKRLTLSFVQTPLHEVLTGMFKQSDLSFMEYGGKVIIKQKPGLLEEEKPSPPSTNSLPDTLLSREEANAKTFALRDSLLSKQGLVTDSLNEKVELSDHTLTLPVSDYLQDTVVSESTSTTGIKITYIPAGETTQVAEEIKYRIAHVGTLYPFSTNGPEAGNYINNISFHLLSGYSRGLQGFELSGIANISRASVEGFQVAGVSNTVGDQTRGAQLAGVTNVNKGEVTGAQFAGIVNVVKGTHRGAQFAGVTNIVTDSLSQLQVSGVLNLTKGNNEFGQVSGLVNKADQVNGVQLSGFLNLQKELHYYHKSARRPSNGVQIAGFMNRAGKLHGAQIAGVSNNADDIKGIQISGLVNKARYIKGAQIGIINIADRMEGASIGLFSIVKQNGYLDLELFYADDFSGNAIIKVGSKKFHNLFGLSYDLRSRERWAYGYGFGSQFGEGMIRLNTDLMSYYVIEQDFPNGAFRDFELNLLNKFRLLGSVHFGDFGIFGGPVLNVMVSKLNGEGLISKLPNPPQVNRTNKSGTATSVWIGYNVGIRF